MAYSHAPVNAEDPQRVHAPTTPDTVEADHDTWSETPPAELLEDGAPRRLGRYELLRRIGAGGMGVVYAALDRERGRRVALKTLRKLEASSLYRLKHEFRAAAGVIHHNLVALYELVSDADQWFITMEYVEGVSFSDYVRSDMHERPDDTVHAAGDETIAGGEQHITQADAPPPRAPVLDIDRLRDALAQLVSGVNALHAAGKLHRDLKSSNVLVTRSGRLVILDFGLISDRGPAPIDVTFDDGILGTPAYMSPEQAAGRPVTAASDWYAVGVMLYEALTGRLPFIGTTLKILSAKQQHDPLPVHEFAPEAPEDLAELCMGLLRRDPSARLTGADLLHRIADVPLLQRRLMSSPSTQVPTLVGR